MSILTSPPENASNSKQLRPRRAKPKKPLSLEIITRILFQIDYQTREDLLWLWRTCHKVSPEFQHAVEHVFRFRLVSRMIVKIAVIDPKFRLKILYKFDSFPARFRCVNFETTGVLMKALLNHVLTEQISDLARSSPLSSSIAMSFPSSSQEPISRVSLYLATDSDLQSTIFLGFVSPRHLNRIILDAADASPFLAIGSLSSSLQPQAHPGSWEHTKQVLADCFNLEVEMEGEEDHEGPLLEA
ncbi:hypothetical protein VKT23_002917 [Stygiomarasmius scandens]|uniref:F-box domain-containing protein n=1 Tax=Marasmiellus scandens TaxID=2682957 RepID=A0ABR1JVJ9_9AGAR